MATIPPPRAEGDAGHLADHDAIRVALIELDSETTAADAHAVDTTAVHGIADTSTLVVTSDSRLTNSRTPLAHKASHSTGGADALTPANIGASELGHNHAGVYAPVSHTHTVSQITATGTPSASTVLYGDGRWAVPPTGSGTGKIPVIIAASNAPQAWKDAALATCGTGNDNQTTINTILSSQGDYGAVLLSPGQFRINGSILLGGVCQTLQGSGYNTEIKAVSLSAVTGYGSAPAMIKLNASNGRFHTLSHFTLNGNSSAGGACSGIYFDMAASPTAYSGGGGFAPSAGSDIQCSFDYIHAENWGGTAGRHAYWLKGDNANSKELRTCRFFRCTARRNTSDSSVAGNAFNIDGASDITFSNCGVGGYFNTAYSIGGGSCRMSFSGASYCEYSIQCTSSRFNLSHFSSQDCRYGINSSGADAQMNMLHLENHEQYALRINAADFFGTGINVLHRTGGRYTATATGMKIDNTSGLYLEGNIQGSNITTPATRPGGSALTASSQLAGSTSRVNLKLPAGLIAFPTPI